MNWLCYSFDKPDKLVQTSLICKMEKKTFSENVAKFRKCRNADSSKGVFSAYFAKFFKENLFERTPSGDCFLFLPLNFEKLFRKPFYRTVVLAAGFQPAYTITISQPLFKHFV